MRHSKKTSFTYTSHKTNICVKKEYNPKSNYLNLINAPDLLYALLNDIAGSFVNYNHLLGTISI